jgi:hypothetical protein
VARSICTYRTGCVEAHTLGTCDLGTCGVCQRQPTSTLRKTITKTADQSFSPPHRIDTCTSYTTFTLFQPPQLTSHNIKLRPQRSVTQHKTRAYDLPYLAYPAFASTHPQSHNMGAKGRENHFAPVTSAKSGAWGFMRRWRKKGVYGNGVLGKRDLFLG